MLLEACRNSVINLLFNSKVLETSLVLVLLIPKYNDLIDYNLYILR